jgi:hypothetical protein
LPIQNATPAASRLAALLALCLLLIGCATAPPPAPGPKDTWAGRPIGPAPAPNPTLKQAMISRATREWEFFGRQTVVFKGSEESIPHVGAWEDDDGACSARVNAYWRTVGKPTLSGIDCQEPWSAAFISWVMQAAGVPKYLFPPGSAHRSYLNHFLANVHNPYAAFIPHTIQEYKPKPGDLICASRSKAKPAAVIEELPDSLNSRLHCDIVEETEGQTLRVIGGNVRNSVSKTVLTLSPEGYLQFTSRMPWLLIIENRLDSLQIYQED